MRNKKDLIPLIIWPFIASALSILLKVNTLYADIIFLLIPSLYLSFKYPRSIVKAGLFSLVPIPIFIFLDFYSNYTGQWIDNLVTSFNFAFFNVVIIEAVLWMVLTSYFAIMFYEYFLDDNKHDNYKFKPRLLILVAIFTIIPLIAFGLFFLSEDPIKVPYFYLIWGSIGMLGPVIVTLLKYRRMRWKLLIVAVYFALFTFIQELTALKMKWWYFPSDGTFIGWFKAFGLQFPLEELLFWILLCAVANIIWYEYFDDDMK